MSLWTPDGERPVGREDDPPAAPPGVPPGVEDLSEEDRARLQAMQAELDDVRSQLLDAPASMVLANHTMGIYELAALHLTAAEPKMAEASLAIDALAALVDGLEGRLGEPEATLREALAQLRTAYVEVSRTSS